MRRLLLDVDALSHGTGLGLLPHIEALIGALADRASIERSTYIEAIRHGLGRTLDDWQRRGLIRDPVDYRACGGEALFREARMRWPGLSKADRATLATARALGDCGILTCEAELSEAAAALAVFPADLFDVLRFEVRDGRLTKAAAAALCAPWDGNAFSEGRPRGYRGSFDAEWKARESSKLLPR